MIRSRVFPALLALSNALIVLPCVAGQNFFTIHSLGNEAGVVYDFKNVQVTNGVFVSYGNAILTAQRATVNQDTGDVEADGDVHIQHEDQVWVGEHIRYNFRTFQMEAVQFRTGRSPVYATGEGLHGDFTNHAYVATNAFITTDDVPNPAVRMRAKRLEIYPGDRFVAYGATLYIGDVPMFYFPYYSRPLDQRANQFNFIPGYRSIFGPYVLGSYRWFLNEQLDGLLRLDYREKRGVGSGGDFNYHLGPWGEGTLKYYYLHDRDPNADLQNVDIPQARQRVNFGYLAIPATNLEIRAVARYQSDPGVVREFFEGEYRKNPQPSSYLEVNKFWDNFSLDAYAQPRFNDFLETVERLPDIRLTGYRQQIGQTPVYYESESSAGYYQRRFPDTNGPVPADYSAARADTFQQLLLPETFFGWLNFTPRVGGRFTYYSRTQGLGATADEVYRGIFNTGAEFSFKASRTWPAARSAVLDVDGLRHIVEPMVNYLYIPDPNRAGTNEIPQFDQELPSLALLPINFPAYNSIDSIDSQNTVRLGIRNKLQTKRRGQVEDLLYWEVFTDWRLHKREDQTTFSDVYSDLIARPRSWLTLESRVRYDVEDKLLRMAFHTLTFNPGNTWSWGLGHFYLRDDFSPSPTALGPGNDTLTSSFFYRLNENWGARATHSYDIRDRIMQEQDYTLYRDFRFWTGAITFRLRDNVGGRNDFAFAFTFSLKAVPRFGLGSDSVRPYSLFGG